MIFQIINEFFHSNVIILKLDFSKAVDMTHHKFLRHKLRYYSVCGKVLNWLEHFLTKRTMRVVVDGVTSKDILG